MSKIARYKEQLRQKAAARDRQTVANFAAELGKSADSLLLQLKEAGIPKQHHDDCLTLKDKRAYLEYLQKSHGLGQRRRIKLTISKHEHTLTKKVSNQENGAEFEALRLFAGAVLMDVKIDPTLQKLVNLIVAKAAFIGTLPLERLGRPKRDDLDEIGLTAAQQYWDLIDTGVGYQDAVEKISSVFHKSERHIMRLISAHKREIGATPELRQENRRWQVLLREMFRKNPDAFERYTNLSDPEVPFPELQLEDVLEHLEELTRELADSLRPLTKKI